MKPKDETKISKYLSYILRHKPDSIGLNLDENGWANIEEIILKTEEFELSYEIIEQVVKNSNKQRFIIKGDMIRANQGHSISIDLALSAKKPPKHLYHGTSESNIPSILSSGINSKKRQYVHLSENYKIAKEVGARHGKPFVLTIDSEQMHKDGYKFYLSDNHVWLTDEVPSSYIILLPDQS